MENPFLDLVLRSKMVLIKYLEDPGEQVRSLVKSDFFPYPMPAPVLRNMEGML
jgi:hypothetical protein